MRRRRPRDAVPRAGHPRRLRRSLPGVQPRLLRLFRAEETPNTVSLTRRCRCSASTTGTSSASTAPSTPTRRRSRRRRRVAERRTIKTDYLARVEGEGAMSVRLRGDTVEHVELRIFEPPRFFEALLRERSFLEPPDITARICGICPVAYQTSAVNAIEDLSAASSCPGRSRRSTPHPLLRRVDPESRAPRAHAPRTGLPRLRRRSRARARRAGGGRARSGAQENRERGAFRR